MESSNFVLEANYGTATEAIMSSEICSKANLFINWDSTVYAIKSPMVMAPTLSTSDS